MKVLDLSCELGHAFEGWFASEDDFASQVKKGILQCPVCGNAEIKKLLSAPYVAAKSNRRAADPKPSPKAVSTPPQAPESVDLATLQAQWLQQARALVQQGENVGENFAQEARRIHEGEAPERLIHGQASVQDVVELLEDGVPVMPLPDVTSGSLQ